MRMRGAALFVVGAVGLALLGGCTVATPRLVDGSSVTVAVSEPFTSRNPDTGYGSTDVNADIAYLTGSGFGYYDDDYNIVRDESFGKAEIVADDPFTVNYTVADGTVWSDGVDVDAVDLLLSWVGNSKRVNTADFDPTGYVDPETGRFTDAFPENVVWFDGGTGAGLDTSPRASVLEGGRTLQVQFAHYFPEWPLAVQPKLPAHVLGEEALGASSASKGTAAVRAAIEVGSGAKLATLSRFWNDGWNFTELPADDALLVASGPYVVSAIDPTAGTVTLAANPRYTGSRQPAIEEIVLRTVTDPMQTLALVRDGEIDVASPAPSAELVAALAGLEGVSVKRGTEGKVEHLELMITGSKTGIFGDPRVRDAFLRTIPRDDILEQLVKPIDPRAEPVESFVFRPGADGYQESVDDNGSIAYSNADPERAERELEEVNPVSREVCILYDSANPRRVAEFGLIRDAAAKGAFVVTDCSSAEWTGLLGVAGSYDAALFAWDTTHLGTTAVDAVYGSPPAPSNYTGFSDTVVDDAVAQLDVQQDPKKRLGLYQEVDSELWRSAYGLPLFAFPTVTLVRDGLQGVSRSPLERGIFWNAWEWTPTETESPAPSE